jgi:hypothetical protein
LFARLGDDVQLVASLTTTEIPDALTARVRDALLDPQSTATITLTVSTADPRNGARVPQRFRVVFLPGEIAADGWVGAVAVREWDELVDRLPDGLLHDIGRVLAADFRATQPPPPPPQLEA